MASYAQYDKLAHIKSYYMMHHDTLAATVAIERLDHLLALTSQLLQQREVLRQERRAVRVQAEQLDDMMLSSSTMMRQEWMPATLSPSSSMSSASSQKMMNADDHHRRLSVKIDGMVFEIPYHIIERDKSSVLYAMISSSSSMQPDPDGAYSFQRDWWLFRYILAFLRDGSIPSDTALLASLYREASFWQLRELQAAIEEDKLHLRDPVSSASGAVPSHACDRNPAIEQKWWRSLPDWLHVVRAEEIKKQDQPPASSSTQDHDWWTDTTYKGKNYHIPAKQTSSS